MFATDCAVFSVHVTSEWVSEWVTDIFHCLEKQHVKRALLFHIEFVSCSCHRLSLLNACGGECARLIEFPKQILESTLVFASTKGCREFIVKYILLVVWTVSFNFHLLDLRTRMFLFVTDLLDIGLKGGENKSFAFISIAPISHSSSSICTERKYTLYWSSLTSQNPFPLLHRRFFWDRLHLK